MKNSIALLSLSASLAASAAFAQQLPSVQVTAEAAEEYLTISCTEPTPPELADLTRILGVTDPSRAQDLRKKTMDAAAEACRAGEPRILVQRTQSGVSWKPVDSPESAQ